MKKIDEETLARLEATAEVAAEHAPGDWKLWGMSVMADKDGSGRPEWAHAVARTSACDANGKPRTWLASHIAAFDPPTALALCAEVRALNDRLNGASVIDHDIRALCHAGKDETAYECVLRMSDALEKLAIRFKDEDYTAMATINRGRGLL